MAKRFLCVTEGDWGNRVVMWGKDHLDIMRLKERRLVEYRPLLSSAKMSSPSFTGAISLKP